MNCKKIKNKTAQSASLQTTHCSELNKLPKDKAKNKMLYVLHAALQATPTLKPS